jgi:hypothetical protein
MKKSRIYLDEAKLALDMLPENFEVKPFLEYLFLTISHYNEYWYNDLNRRDLYAILQKNMNGTVKTNDN